MWREAILTMRSVRITDRQSAARPKKAAARRHPFVFWFPWCCAGSSWISFMSQFLLGVHYYVLSGHAPRPFVDGSDDPLFRAHCLLTLVPYFFALLIAPILWLTCLTIPTHRPTLKHGIIQCCVFVLGIATIAFCWLHPPSPFDWAFLD